MSIPELNIVPETGVPQRRPAVSKGRTRNPQIAAYIDKLCRMRIGESCFFQGLTSGDVEFLRRPAVTAGITLTIREVEKDEIHMVSGVRIWRGYGEFDEL